MAGRSEVLNPNSINVLSNLRMKERFEILDQNSINIGSNVIIGGTLGDRAQKKSMAKQCSKRYFEKSTNRKVEMIKNKLFNSVIITRWGWEGES